MKTRLFIAATALGVLTAVSAPVQADDEKAPEGQYVKLSQVPSRESWAMVREDRAQPRDIRADERRDSEPRRAWLWAGPHRVGVHMMRR